MQELKRRTRCQSCGEIGHWAGDQQCAKNKFEGKGHGHELGKGKSQGHDSRPARHVANVAYSWNEEYCVSFTATEAEDSIAFAAVESAASEVAKRAMADDAAMIFVPSDDSAEGAAPAS